MSSTRLSTKRVFAALAVTGCLLTSLPAVSFAQGGLTIFSGVERENQLKGFPQNGRSGNWDRYKLEIPAKKMKLAVSQISISYPNYYKGEFDTKEVEIQVKGKKVPLQEVTWNPENYLIEIFPQEPIPAGNKVEITLSNVRNPTFGGMFYFNCRILSPGDVPLVRYLGTWILSIN